MFYVCADVQFTIFQELLRQMFGLQLDVHCLVKRASMSTGRTASTVRWENFILGKSEIASTWRGAVLAMVKFRRCMILDQKATGHMLGRLVMK